MTTKELILAEINTVETEAEVQANTYRMLDEEISILLTKKTIARRRVDSLVVHINDLKRMLKATS